MKKRPISSVMAAMLLIALLSMQPAFSSGNAPDAPGVKSAWAPAPKSFLGTSASNISRVYFTGYRSIVTEIFYPTLDNPNTVDLQFLIGDSNKTFVDEEKIQASYTAALSDTRSMAWNVSTSNPGHNWKIDKTIFVDPTRHALIQRTTFIALNGKNVSNFNVYILHNPSIDNQAMGDTAKVLSSNGRTLLVASKMKHASAIGISLPWKNIGGTAMTSVGFVGVNDGWTDLLGGSADKTMDYTYAIASNGNVAQLGWIDFGASTATSVSFDVVMGFAATEAEAMNTANAILTDNISALRTTYDNEWHAYNAALSTQGGTADDQYYLAAMSLKSIQDKSNGAMIAGMGTPWGETADDTKNTGGYHLVWARDLFKFANAMITAGDTKSALSATNFLFNRQQQANGRFPQNSQVDGTPYWNGTQMDEQAMPILLAYRLGPKIYNPIWPKIKLAADFIVANGPWTQQERWEETSGYSPSTIAAEIAGLVAAAKIAVANNDTASAAAYMRTADYWQQNVSRWTYTKTGQLGNGSYYLRINPAGKAGTGAGLHAYDPVSGPDSPSTYTVGNGGGMHDQRKIIDGGFLELVRMGIKSPLDSTIATTIPVYDSAIKQTISGKGDAWFRYNFDGYGEQNNGANYTGAGRGRLWPIFTAERGMYEIAKSGIGSNGDVYLRALKAFSTPEGFVSEQVWNYTASITPGIDGGWQTTTPFPYIPGNPTKSIAPLSWAMGEYINLLASINAGRVVDIPQSVCSRYNNCTIPPSAGQIQLQVKVKADTSPGQWMYITGNLVELGGWNTDLGIPVDPATYPTWTNKINLPASTVVLYKYYRKNDDGSITWENLPNAGNRTLNTPVSGLVLLSDTVNW